MAGMDEERSYQQLIQELPFEVWDYDNDRAYFARSIEQALRFMRRCYDAKITRLSDNVVLAQSLNGVQL